MVHMRTTPPFSPPKYERSTEKKAEKGSCWMCWRVYLGNPALEHREKKKISEMREERRDDEQDMHKKR